VDAPPELRRARLLATRALSTEEADRMIAVQAPSGPKRARSTYVIDNDGDRATLEARTRAVWNELLRLT
jgi:dephospho-CoA kinase